MLSSFQVELVEKKEFPPVPEDMYQVELFDITEKWVDSKFDIGKKERMLSFQFVILDEGEHRGRCLWRNNVPSKFWTSSKVKNTLLKITEAIVCRNLTEMEKIKMTSDFINKLIGYQCRVVIKNTVDTNNKVWNNIESFLPKKMTLPALNQKEREAVTFKPKDEKPEVAQVSDDEITAAFSPATLVDDNIPVIDVATGLPVVETTVDASGEATTPKIETLDLDAIPENSNPKLVPF